MSYRESLSAFPLRGVRGDDIRQGLRIINYKKRAVIAFDVDADQVSIIGIVYGGQGHEAILREDIADSAH